MDQQRHAEWFGKVRSNMEFSAIGPVKKYGNDICLGFPDYFGRNVVHGASMTGPKPNPPAVDTLSLIHI